MRADDMGEAARDIVVAGGVALLAVAASMAYPPEGDMDAGLFFVDAARVVHGQLPYRDFETYVSPGALAIQAAAFRQFGLTIEAARGVHHALQAILAIALFA